MGEARTNAFLRTEMLIGPEKLRKIRAARVIVFGVGGVGGYAAEALARSGVGRIELVDCDIVTETNLNRQIVALHSTLGMKKTAVMAARILDINPDCAVVGHDVFYASETAAIFDFTRFDYVVDAIDTVSSKLLLIERCSAVNTPVICSMGTGNKLNPALLQVAPIEETSGCPLARVMRRELKKRGLRGIMTVYSPEEPQKPLFTDPAPSAKRAPPGTLPFVPAAAGLLLAKQVVTDLMEKSI